ncbi:hypothetical protein VHA01S_076_00070 [Vibrio halioticoli NBRC 102217]|uniref:Uncharacterized protein n=1 Tax=Vibrio halioticoli NBRC 102217 TaxID=1219072 RepID=V5F6A5_9VIBR|nr:hypothetical protein VHA01S_076_00070 [Vibrio halioticoli NBRC 102217]
MKDGDQLSTPFEIGLVHKLSEMFGLSLLLLPRMVCPQEVIIDSFLCLDLEFKIFMLYSSRKKSLLF